MKLTKLLFYTIITCLILSNCKTRKIDEDIIISSHKLYNDGLVLLKKQKYLKAADQFSRIFYQDPSDEMTPQAELMQAYSLHLAAQYEESISVLNTFIKLHPMHKNIAYAYYLKALSYYMQVSNIQLDQSRTFLAKESFEDVIRLFPKSNYSIDAPLKINLINDYLAAKEMDVGRYYLNKNNPIAAINRFQPIINNYQTTSHISEALYRLVESYLMLGLVVEAKKHAAILGHNYPDSYWYKCCYSLLKQD